VVLAERANLPQAGVVWRQESAVQLVAELAADADNAAVLQQCLTQLPVADVKLEEPTIEAVVQALYGERR
jgi:ABC-type uncharacterized transport system ATPase subunit